MNFLYFAIIGLASGWLTGKLLKGEGYGFWGNLLLGLAGSFIGGHVFEFFGFTGDNSTMGSIVTATVGALLLVFLVGKAKGK